MTIPTLSRRSYVVNKVEKLYNFTIMRFPTIDSLTICCLQNYITRTSYWARWRLKSPASRWFTQAFIQAQIKENRKALRHWPLWWGFTGHWWIPRTKGQWRGKGFHLMTLTWILKGLCHFHDCGCPGDRRSQVASNNNNSVLNMPNERVPVSREEEIQLPASLGMVRTEVYFHPWNKIRTTSVGIHPDKIVERNLVKMMILQTRSQLIKFPSNTDENAGQFW